MTVRPVTSVWDQCQWSTDPTPPAVAITAAPQPPHCPSLSLAQLVRLVDGTKLTERPAPVVVPQQQEEEEHQQPLLQWAYVRPAARRRRRHPAPTVIVEEHERQGRTVRRLRLGTPSPPRQASDTEEDDSVVYLGSRAGPMPGAPRPRTPTPSPPPLPPVQYAASPAAQQRVEPAVWPSEEWVVHVVRRHFGLQPQATSPFCDGASSKQ
jgi:hypothetical protein